LIECSLRNPINQQTLALYLHIPFCKTRCTYCAFNTYTGQSDRIEPYMKALAREIRLVGAKTPAYTIYFGGGTPSLAPVLLLEQVLRACADAFDLAPHTEITLEANPGTVDQTYLNDLRGIGINRISIGMQSSDPAELQLFARSHNGEAVGHTVRMARSAGFDNLSLDLIYGVPHQRMVTWQNSLNAALDLEPEHLSLYALGIEEGTPMQRWVDHGDLPLPDPDLAADMYDWATERLAAAGFEQYEVSNWSKPGYACRHNVHYWRNLPYLGLGAGAHGYAAGIRYINTLRPVTYIERIEGQTAPLSFPLTAAVDSFEQIDETGSMAEMMIMGMRLIQEGVALDDFRRRYGCDLWDVYGAELDRLIEYGLVERISDDRIRLTSRGRLLGNRVFEEFV
jgi:oxygen-independent coproporphyrinogen-3 oxidase